MKDRSRLPKIVALALFYGYLCTAVLWLVMGWEPIHWD